MRLFPAVKHYCCIEQKRLRNTQNVKDVGIGQKWAYMLLMDLAKGLCLDYDAI